MIFSQLFRSFVFVDDLMRIVDGESLKSVDFVREFQGKFKGNSKAFSGS